ncbi:hypothetical protein M409DRAFT_54120 [Zasmidium cellare ATCC 36951]|uniref:F-box domain-containing protein n=1 Tax=Zasmidium cellare ATCC 36951 TaxID=1080233 RepID=A0A6A6CNM8_ZASCE|nr:uncharacterized protein M409DRAFT_54120 [Zasmidium cellare ATCC 36951]KAF2167522.1 hypothetical protein M409DRAFT_54120 [Zasmidium cellare ATCC 36951]
MTSPTTNHQGQQEPPKEKASTKVGTTYELLEPILIRLPTNDLFTMRRVNTMWRDLIKSSDDIKKANGVKASQPALDPAPIPHGGPPNITYSTPGLQLTRALHVERADIFNQGRAKPGHAICAWVSGSHAASRSIFDEVEWSNSHVVIDVRLYFSAVDEPYASWQEALLTDPPIKTLTIKTNGVPGNYRFSHAKTIDSDTGLTLGDVYRAHKDYIKECWERFNVRMTSDRVHTHIRIKQDNVELCEGVQQNGGGSLCKHDLGCYPPTRACDAVFETVVGGPLASSAGGW